MKRKIHGRVFKITLSALVVVFIAGCVHSKPKGGEFGERTRDIFSKQVIHPEAPDDKTPVDGYPGDVAGKAYEDYKSREELEAVYNIDDSDSQR